MPRSISGSDNSEHAGPAGSAAHRRTSGSDSSLTDVERPSRRRRRRTEPTAVTLPDGAGAGRQDDRFTAKAVATLLFGATTGIIGLWGGMALQRSTLLLTPALGPWQPLPNIPAAPTPAYEPPTCNANFTVQPPNADVATAQDLVQMNINWEEEFLSGLSGVFQHANTTMNGSLDTPGLGASFFNETYGMGLSAPPPPNNFSHELHFTNVTLKLPAGAPPPSTRELLNQTIALQAAPPPFDSRSPHHAPPSAYPYGRHVLDPHHLGTEIISENPQLGAVLASAYIRRPDAVRELFGTWANTTTLALPVFIRQGDGVGNFSRQRLPVDDSVDLTLPQTPWVQVVGRFAGLLSESDLIQRIYPEQGSPSTYMTELFGTEPTILGLTAASDTNVPFNLCPEAAAALYTIPGRNFAGFVENIAATSRSMATIDLSIDASVNSTNLIINTILPFGTYVGQPEKNGAWSGILVRSNRTFAITGFDNPYRPTQMHLYDATPLPAAARQTLRNLESSSDPAKLPALATPNAWLALAAAFGETGDPWDNSDILRGPGLRAYGHFSLAIEAAASIASETTFAVLR